MPDRSIITARALLAAFKKTTARRQTALSPAAAKKIELLSRDGYHRRAIDCFNEAVKFHGTEEASQRSYGDGYFIYANSGEAYDLTLTFSYIDRNYRIISHGDLVEMYERKGVRFE